MYNIFNVGPLFPSVCHVVNFKDYLLFDHLGWTIGNFGHSSMVKGQQMWKLDSFSYAFFDIHPPQN